MEIDGRPIKTQTDLRFALGPRYGGESVRIVAMRGDERIERTIKLAGKLKAFRHAFLGILPLRTGQHSARAKTDANAKKDSETESDAEEEADAKRRTKRATTMQRSTSDAAKSVDEKGAAGIAVRMVYPASPAAEAGIEAGDRVVRINDTDIDSIDDAIEEMNGVAPGGEVTVKVMREGIPGNIKLTAARLPTGVPDQLPPAYETGCSAGGTG